MNIEPTLTESVFSLHTLVLILLSVFSVEILNRIRKKIAYVRIREIMDRYESVEDFEELLSNPLNEVKIKTVEDYPFDVP